MDLDRLISEYKVFVDTCTFMHPRAPDFFNRILPVYIERYNQKIILARKVADELNRLQEHKNKETRERARAGARIVNEYLRVNWIEVMADESDPFADNTFIYVFTKFRAKYNLALITQDKSLARDIYNLKALNSVSSNKDLQVFKLNIWDGSLGEWNFNSPDISGRSADAGHGTSSNSIKKFQLHTTPINRADSIIPVSHVPGENDYVRSVRYGEIKLVDTLGSGGEGTIYVADNRMVCKIYNRERITTLKQEKIQLMLQNPINTKGICWPKDMLYNRQNQFVGYLMDRAEGKPMQHSMFIKPVLKKNFPHWTRKHLVELCITVLLKINYLHQRNIIIGDINPLNIMINNEKEVYFVDTDSYQLENFPCPVGTINFTAPEIQGEDYKTFLRSFEHEYFAVATLLFMILLPGKPPYSHEGGGSPAENIRKMEFSYPFGSNSNRKTPEGPWRFIWSNLPYRIKEAFYGVFKQNNRITPREWLKLLKQYLHAVENGFVSDELFPATLKIINPVEVKCAICGAICEDNEEWIEKLKSLGKDYICRSCGEQIKLRKQSRQQNPLPHQFQGKNYNQRARSTSSSRTYQRPARPQPARRPQPPGQSNDIFSAIIKFIFGR